MPIDFDTHVCARLGDYFGQGVQWQRRLWRVGAVLALREIAEASDGVAQGALSPESFTWLSKRTRENLRRDPGLSDTQEKTLALKTLSEDLTAGGVGQRQVILIADELAPAYLDRLRDSLGLAPAPAPESFAVALASHLLDAGVSRTRLHVWLTDLLAHQNPVPAQDLLTAAQTLLDTGPTDFEVLLTVAEDTKTSAPRPDRWRTRGQAAAWLIEQGVETRPRQSGGLLLTLSAWDARHAAAQAHDFADRLSARAAVGTKVPLVFHSEVFVAGHTDPFPLKRRRRADVRALERQRALFDLAEPTAVDSALELLAQLDMAPSPVAVAGGWSAVESLLTAPGDRGNTVAADRLAALVACSWPRAELTTLAWARVNQEGGDNAPLAQELRDKRENREKAEVMLRAINDGVETGLTRPAELAGVERMRDLVADPNDVLNRVRTHAMDTLRRLYRQRNLVLHGGQTQAVALEATLRTAAPLVGAGLDRVTHAFLVHARSPLDTAARGDYRLKTLGGPGEPSVLALFDDP